MRQCGVDAAEGVRGQCVFSKFRQEMRSNFLCAIFYAFENVFPRSSVHNFGLSRDGGGKSREAIRSAVRSLTVLYTGLAKGDVK